MKVEIVNSYKAFNSLREDWNNLLAQVSCNNPFLSHEWMQTWWEVYGHGMLHIITCRDSCCGELVGILPLFCCRTRNLLPVTMLRFMGSERVSSDFLDCLAREGWEKRVYSACLAILQSAACKWDIIELRDMDENSLFYRFLIEANIPRLQEQHDRGKCCPFLALPDSWEELLSSFSANKRRNIRRYRQALERKGVVSLEEVTNLAELAEAFLDVIRLRQDRMKQKKITTARITESYCRFHSNLLPSFLKNGRLRLYFLVLNKQRIAYLYMYAGYSRVYAYQTGFDRTMSNQSVGSILFAMVIEQLIKDGYAIFDFLRGDEKYKYEWGNVQERHLVDVVITKRTLPAKLWLINKNILARAMVFIKSLIAYSGASRPPIPVEPGH